MKTTNYCGISAFILIFTSFSTCRFYLIKCEGFSSFLPRYIISLVRFPTRPCHAGALASRHIHGTFLLKVGNTQAYFTRTARVFEAHHLLCLLPWSRGRAGAACLTAQQAHLAAGQWPSEALACPCNSQTHWGSSSSALSSATLEFVGRLPVTQWIKQQWYFGGVHEITTEVALALDHTVESD